MKRSTLTVALYTFLAILLAYSFASAIAAAGEPGDLIGGQRPSDVTPMPQPVLPDLEPADFALRLYRIEQRLDKLESSRQVSQQPCNCASGGECTCGANCQCGKPTAPAKPAGLAAVVDPVTGITVYGPTVIMISTPGCGPCVMWWGIDGQPSERAAVKARGWTTERTENVAAASYPRYRIFDGLQWFDHVGPLKADRVADLRRR